jgi:hypothetical protein
MGMKSIFKTFIFTTALLILSTTAVIGTSETRETKVVTVRSDEVINRSFYLGGGDIVEISGIVNGDVLVAGGQLLVDGVVNGDLLAAGGTINVSGNVSENIRIGGGQITISGNVGRNLTAVGGNIEVTDSADIAGGALIAGGNVNLSAPVAGDVLAGVGNLTLANKIGGDVEAYVGTMRLTSKSEVDGDVVYYSEENASVDKGAQISGKITKKLPPSRLVETKDIDAAGFNYQAKIISFLAALVVGLILIKLFPNFMKGSSDILSNNWLKSVGVGLLLLIVVPIAAILMLITLVGIPLAIIIGFLYLIYLYLAKIFVTYTVGATLYKGEEKRLYLPFILALLVYYIISSIPNVGGLVAIVVHLMGIGALYLACREYYDKAVKAKLL